MEAIPTVSPVVRVGSDDGNHGELEDPINELLTVQELPAQKRQKTERSSIRRVNESPSSVSTRSDREKGIVQDCTKINSGKANSKQQDKEDMAWICAECKEADCGLIARQEATAESNELSIGDSFLICDGSCHRIFHVPCAGLARLPNRDDPWLCNDCVKREHACAFCTEYGKDNIDVFPCQHDLCGLFFHESCLQTHRVEYVYSKYSAPAAKVISSERQSSYSPSEDNHIDQDIADIPLFNCPAHNCWTCTQTDMIQLEKDEEQAELQYDGGKSSKKKKQRKKKQSIFQSKKGRLFRCLYCPTAYHVTCIPPVARFHELAVLCHEHAMTHRLPELDMTSSIQSKLEEKVDETLMRIHGIRDRTRNKRWLSFGRGTSSNPFFRGLRGDRFDSYELKVLQTLKAGITAQKVLQLEPLVDPSTVSLPINPVSVASMAMDNKLPFCLPVDMKKEVYSKPPLYNHIQSLKYNTDKLNRPKKIVVLKNEEREKCSCIDMCGSDCFNRVTMSECVGPFNCNLGTKDCGNRALGKRQFVKCQPKRERGKGWGLVVLEFVEKGKLVQEYMGEVIDEAEKERRLRTWNEEHPNDPNFYVMALSSGYYVDAREYANLARFINHSCDPNCKVTSVNVKGYIRNGIYSLRDIRPGEFLSYDYHFDTKQGDRFVCRCGAPNCRGTMKGLGKEDLTRKPSNWKEAKTRYDLDKKFLEEADASSVVCLVDSMLPLAENSQETIANGPPSKHRTQAIRSRIFLWRNVRLGADFVSRNSRLEKRAATKVKRSSSS